MYMSPRMDVRILCHRLCSARADTEAYVINSGILTILGWLVVSPSNINWFSKFAKQFFNFVLLVHLFHLLKTVVNGDLYMSHTLSRNEMDGNDFDVIISMRDS